MLKLISEFVPGTVLRSIVATLGYTVGFLSGFFTCNR